MAWLCCSGVEVSFVVLISCVHWFGCLGVNLCIKLCVFADVVSCLTCLLSWVLLFIACCFVAGVVYTCGFVALLYFA